MPPTPARASSATARSATALPRPPPDDRQLGTDAADCPVPTRTRSGILVRENREARLRAGALKEMSMALVDTLRITTVSVAKDRVEATMPITPDLFQPFGFLHGGATIALLETGASIGTEQSTDFDVERPFGIDVHVRHRKSGTAGLLRGVAELEREEPARSGGTKQFWRVVAFDDAGDVVSDGTIMTKIVPLARLEEKARERAANREQVL